MAYDLELAERVRTRVGGDASEKKMFGGVAWMVGGNMAVGIVKDDLMVRVGPDAHEDALAQPHARPMDFSGKPMVGMVYVAPAGVADDAALDGWVGRGVAFARSLPAKDPKPPKASKAPKKAAR